MRLSELSIRKRLAITNIGLVIVVCAIIFSIVEISYLIHKVTKERAVNIDFNNDVRKIGFEINDFFLNKIKIDIITSHYDSLKQTHSSNAYVGEMEPMIEKLKDVDKLNTENASIEKEIMELTDKSIEASQTYIKEVSLKLADPAKQSKVSKLERLVIIGASTNTSAGYTIKVLFKNLKEDIQKKTDIQSFLDLLLTNVERDEKSLANTPFAELPRTAKASNLKIKDNVQKYITNIDKINAIGKEIDSSLTGLVNKLNMEELAYSGEQMAKIRNSVLIVVVISLIISLGVIGLNVTLSNNLRNFITYMVESFRSMSNGKINTRMYAKYLERNDEIGHLTRALESYNIKLKEIIANIFESSKQVSSAALQFSASSQQLSQGASEQASSVEEVSSSMEQMVSNIQQNTDNAKQTETISKQSAEVVGQVDKSSQESLNAVKEIAQKITIINDIAFQTNILALNAAVEAARAGESGHGLAVVAAEVRKLAERSKIAADEIDLLSKSSVTITNEAGTVMAQLIPEILKTSSLIQEITSASIEQNAGAEQINSAIQHLNQVTQQNAATAEEMATSAEELLNQAEHLKEIISFFEFENNTTKIKRN